MTTWKGEAKRIRNKTKNSINTRLRKYAPASWAASRDYYAVFYAYASAMGWGNDRDRAIAAAERQSLRLNAIEEGTWNP